MPVSKPRCSSRLGIGEAGIGINALPRAVKQGDGRTPYGAFANLNKQDVDAIVAYLRSLPPVANKVPGPFGPAETPTSFVMKVVPPGAK